MCEGVLERNGYVEVLESKTEVIRTVHLKVVGVLW